ncbi:MAG: AIR synthase-related protein, partial [Candidatus Bathyarchaeia archaeon]
LPERAKRETVETITMQMDKAAKELEIAIVGGHCEVTPGLKNPIVIGCAMGVTEGKNYVTSAGAKPGDKLILTKSAGIEGTAILATDREKQLKKVLDPVMLRNAKNFYNYISIVKDALLAYKTGGVNAMHDPTEGGVLGGIHEMADASNLGVKIFEEKIFVREETAKICDFFGIDPLQLIGSGALLISVKPEFADEIIKTLKNDGIYASIIGEFIQNSKERTFIRKDNETQALPRPVCDHLWIALHKGR